jgi:acyl carrier protein
MTAFEALRELQDIIESLGLSIAPDQPMFSAGLDSMSLQALSEKIRARFDFDIPVSQFFDYVDARALADGIASSFAPEPNGVGIISLVPGESSGDMVNTEILSVSYSFPNNAMRTLYKFNCASPSEVDNVRTVPLNRWDMEQRMHLFEGMCILSCITFKDNVYQSTKCISLFRW